MNDNMQKSSKVLDKTSFGNIQSPLKTKTATVKIKQKIVKCSLVEEENAIYVSQLQELARVFSSSSDKHIRQYIINLAKGVIERANDYKKVEAYVDEVLS